MHSKTLRRVAAAALLGGLLSILAAPSAAQRAGVQVVTAYPAVTVEAGKTVTLDLQVITPSRQRVALAVVEVPQGWNAVLRGGGFVINGVFGAPEEPPAVQLEIQVPPETPQGDFRVLVQGQAGGVTDVLQVDVKISESAPGAVTLEPDFTTLRGAASDTFNFNVTLTNNTPDETTFNLNSEGPEGWTVSARPSGQEQAATVNVEGGGTATISVSADPPDETTADTYPITVTASGEGKSAEVGLEIEITGNQEMTLTTPDERLNADARAGRATNIALVVRNEGTAPLNGVSVTSTPPTGWRITFNPETVTSIAPKEDARVTARMVPSEDAVAGDYSVTFSASGEGVTSEAEMRITLKASLIGGIIGVVLILAVLGGLYWVFQTYGRR
ncbi:MAG: NEW3 domain-containing protein [Actinomycetota bacterium]